VAEIARLTAAEVTRPVVHTDATLATADDTLIAFDFENDEQALAVGEKVAAVTGIAVTVRNSEGEVLGTFKAATRN
jgi:hypothetical protein